MKAVLLFILLHYPLPAICSDFTAKEATRLKSYFSKNFGECESKNFGMTFHENGSISFDLCRETISNRLAYEYGVAIFKYKDWDAHETSRRLAYQKFEDKVEVGGGHAGDVGARGSIIEFRIKEARVNRIDHPKFEGFSHKRLIRYIDNKYFIQDYDIISYGSALGAKWMIMVSADLRCNARKGDPKNICPGDYQKALDGAVVLGEKNHQIMLDFFR